MMTRQQMEAYRRTRTPARHKTLWQECRSYQVNRRNFLQGGLALGAGLMPGPLSFPHASEAKTTQVDSDGVFTLGQRNDHWWLITPDGKPFFTMGINHIDPASLRYPENIEIWREKYGGSNIRWIHGHVVHDILA